MPSYELDVIQTNNRNSVNMCRDCLIDMFCWWLRNGEEVTAETLAKAVHKVGQHKAEVEIKQRYGMWCFLLPASLGISGKG